MIRFIFVVIVILNLLACESSSDLSSNQALSMVKSELEETPMYETGKFDTKKLRLNSTKDQKLVNTLQSLELEGLIDIVEEKKRKKWFSKDSVYIITPTLTDKAYPYVVKQNRNHTIVKTLNYALDDSQEISFEKKNDRVAIFNVMLLKRKTPFYHFGKDANPNSDFVTKQFKAKYKAEEGWYLVE